MLKIHSYCLPYFFENKVSIFLLDGRKIKVPLSQFQDVTTEGGRFHQFYTFLIRSRKNGFERNEEILESLTDSQNSL